MKHLKKTLLMALATTLACTTMIFASANDNEKQMEISGYNYTTNTITTDTISAFDQTVVSGKKRLISFESTFANSKTIFNTPLKQVSGSTSVFPYNAIVKLEITYAGSNAVHHATGFMVNSRKGVTVGHAIYDSNYGWATSIKVTPGVNGNSMPYGAAYSADSYVPTAWTNNHDYAYDFGVIILDRNYNFSNYFNLSTSASYTTQYTIAGYPVSKPSKTLWWDNGRLSNISDSFLEYKIAGLPGQSGAPVFNGTTAIGFHAYEIYNTSTGQMLHNEAMRLTDSIVNFVNAM